MTQPTRLVQLAAITFAMSGCLAPGANSPLPAVVTAGPGNCVATQTLPAVVETVTEHVLVKPEAVNDDGQIVEPAVYRTQTRQAIVRERQNSTYATPCPQDMTPEFVASLQRALTARGYYNGPIDGQMTPATNQAVARYQSTLGLPSEVLSIETARKLGLVVYDRQDILNGNI